MKELEESFSEKLNKEKDFFQKRHKEDLEKITHFENKIRLLDNKLKKIKGVNHSDGKIFLKFF